MNCTDWASIVNVLSNFNPATQPDQLTSQAIYCVQRVLWVTSPQVLTTDSVIWLLLLFVHIAILIAFMISFFALFTSF